MDVIDERCYVLDIHKAGIKAYAMVGKKKEIKAIDIKGFTAILLITFGERERNMPFHWSRASRSTYGCLH